jgi:hypothetical protein
MHKTPSQIARSLRGLRNAQNLGLLRSVRIEPGRDACETVVAQFGTDYSGNAVPSLPLTQCNRSSCECNYVPIATVKLRRPNAE